jgi:hypothetical protein
MPGMKARSQHVQGLSSCGRTSADDMVLRSGLLLSFHLDIHFPYKKPLGMSLSSNWRCDVSRPSSADESKTKRRCLFRGLVAAVEGVPG